MVAFLSSRPRACATAVLRTPYRSQHCCYVDGHQLYRPSCRFSVGTVKPVTQPAADRTRSAGIVTEYDMLRITQASHFTVGLSIARAALEPLAKHLL